MHILGLNLAQFGLIFDVIGVILLYRFGLPSKIVEENFDGLVNPVVGVETDARRLKNKKIIAGANAGLFCIIIGSVLQFINYFF